MGERCSACRMWIPDGATTGESSLYSPDRAFTLCEPCWLAEDALIDERGTNNLPEELSRYYGGHEKGHR